MSMVAKILIVLNLILAVAVMGAAGTYLQSAEKWKGEYAKSDEARKQENREKDERLKKLQDSLDEANRGKAAAQQERAQFEAANRTLSENSTLLQKKYDEMNASVQGINAGLRDMAGNLDSARQANQKLQADLTQAGEDRRAALDAQAKAETEQKRLTNELANTAASLDSAQKNGVDLSDKLEAANTRLEMYRAKFGDIGIVAAPVKGQVLAVDSAVDLYLISVGSKDGLKVADELTVFRGDSFVALVVVDRVFDDKASVTVKKVNGKPFKKSDIRQGDKVANVF
jgi:hypothetical protein